MKILHVSTYDRGGAAKACIRLHESLISSGYDSHILFLYSSDAHISNIHIYQKRSIYPFPKVDRLIMKAKKLFYTNTLEKELKREIKSLIPHQIEWFSFPDTNFDITTLEIYKQADIIHLHWVADFLDYSFFKKNKKPVLWTLHDMNPFSGGCHYADSSRGFQRDCSNCPQLQQTKYPDYSKLIFNYKRRYMNMAKNVSIATPSHWLSKESQSSSIFSTFNHYVVPNGVDSKVYNTVDKDSARAKLGLPSDKKIVLFVSDSLKTSRKGFAVLMDALHQLKARGEYLLCMIGSGETEHIAAELATHSLGYIHNEEAISEAYSAADIFVIPSLADNLPNTVLESLMCGTPVVGFPVGGIVDMIQHGKNGLLCSEVSSASLAESLQLAFSGNFTFDSAQIRKDAIKRYDIRMQVRNYADLYRKISKHD